jgi:hypothetical protein
MKVLLYLLAIPAAVVAVLAIAVTAVNLPILAALWIPLLLVLFLAAFPFLAITAGKSMLEGMFDLDVTARFHLPARLFLVTLAAFSIAGAASRAARLALRYAPIRFGTGAPFEWDWVKVWVDLNGNSSHATAAWAIGALVALTLPMAGVAIWVSKTQDSRRSLPLMLFSVLLAMAISAGIADWLLRGSHGFTTYLANSTQDNGLAALLGNGYTGPAWPSHLNALLTLVVTFGFYLALGIYGWLQLGKPRTVPALVGLQMVVLMAGWIGSATEFFLGRWHIPLLLLVAAWAVVNSFIKLADHTYTMVERSDVPAAEPAQVLTANGRKCALVVASAGGGIQSAAWTAQVLEGLRELHGEAFDKALCLISSISGGSTGSACYVNWLAKPTAAVAPTAAASASSLDEVGWGLAWPDLWRLLLPWPFGLMIDRARALEIAWAGNATLPGNPPQLESRLSDWNEPVAKGRLPALIMNSTMVEVGAPLLNGTSDVNAVHSRVSGGWMDGDTLHRIGDREMDISVARAARLSATFPYVTPVARPANANLQPHMIDGGFYDNYGIATLTEWLDQALEATHKPGEAQQVSRILVLEISGFPPADFKVPPTPQTHGGWFLQLIAPVTTLMNARTAGQVSHRDIELKLLQQKWKERKVEIDVAKFDFDPALPDGKKPDPPLSWHLMPLQIKAIRDEWRQSSAAINHAKKQVAEFLAKC